MPIELTMPRLSDTMEQGTIIKWNVKEGDEVSSGDVVADIETDKATMEMQAFDDGVISSIVVDEGTRVPVGTLIALILEDGEEAPSSTAATEETVTIVDDLDDDGFLDDPEPVNTVETVETPMEEPAPVELFDIDTEPVMVDVQQPKSVPSVASIPPSAANAPMRVSPLARRLAEEHGIDLAGVQGSGPSGRIIKRDILAAVESAAANTSGAATSIETAAPLAIPDSTPTPVAIPALQSRDVPVTGVRQTIARRLVQSKQTIPHYQVTMRFSMDALVELRSTLNAQLAGEGVKLSVNDFIVRACALSMKHHEMFNASWAGDHIVVHGQVNVGVAVSLPEERGGGLVVATIRDADQKSLRMLSEESRTLALKARERGLSPEDMSDSTFTISNLGMFGVDDFTAIINPPNSAILACGAAIEQPVVRDHQLAVGWEMAATLSLDHRVIDGAMAAAYLKTLKGMIEEPMRLLV